MRTVLILERLKYKMININNNTTFASSLIITDEKCFNLKALIDDIVSDLEVSMNLSKHTGNIRILQTLQKELNDIKETIDDFQEDRLALIILRLIDDKGNEVIDESELRRDHYKNSRGYMSL
jgi:hypothetical protein